MSDNGLLLTDVIKKQASTDPKSIAKSKNPAFIDQTSGIEKITVEDNKVLSATEEHSGNAIILSGTINSENRVYTNTDKGELENGFDGKTFADGVYETEVVFIPEETVNSNKNEPTEIDINKTPAKVRCSCPHYRFYYSNADKKENFLSGGDFPSYTKKTDTKRPSPNPNNNVGMCKHLIYFVSHLLKSNSSNYPKIIDSSNSWNSTISGVSVDLTKPKQKARPYTKKPVSGDIRVNNILRNSLKLTKATSVRKPAVNTDTNSMKDWEKYIDDAYRKLRTYDRLANRYGDNTGLDQGLQQDNIDGFTKDTKTLGDLRKSWVDEYNKRAEEFLIRKYKDKNVVDNIIKANKEKQEKDPNYRFVIPTKLTRRTRGGSGDLEQGKELKTTVGREVKRQKGYNDYLIAQRYIKDRAKKQNKTPAEVKTELLVKATAKKMRLSKYILSLIDKQTKINNNKNNPLKNKSTKVDNNKSTKKTVTMKDKIQKALSRKNKLVRQLALNKNLKADDENKLSVGQTYEIRKQIDQLDRFLKMNMEGYNPGVNTQKVTKQSIANVQDKVPEPKVSKTQIKKSAKPKTKETKTTVIKKLDTGVSQKKPELPKSKEPIKQKFDPATYDFEAKRDEKTGRIIIPEKPSDSSKDETKYFYLKSIKAKLNELKMLSKNMENGRVRSAEEQKKSVDKLMNKLSNELISGCSEFDIDLQDI